MHTLVYPADNHQKLTVPHDLVFYYPITFKIALMVVRYMKYMETLEY